jgi:uncharacterized protein
MTETQTLRPVTAGDRHMSLDVLRGLGVMGILAVNAVAFALPMDVYMTPNLSPFSMAGTEGDAWWVVQTFFHYKFVTLFSMLFGVSLLLVGGERSDKPRGALLRRRLGWLTLFGLIHGLLIWYGDILALWCCCSALGSRAPCSSSPPRSSCWDRPWRSCRLWPWTMPRPRPAPR